MPFGAHESMEAHEMLNEKINMINHFSMYDVQCQDSSLKQMINRHMQSTIQSYNAMVRYTHDYTATGSNPTSSYQQQPQQIQYGLNNPAPQSPQVGGTMLTDTQIASAMLCAHKNSAKNHMAAALECADPNVRQMMVNSAVTCEQQAYEVFNFMNRMGWYQVPTLNDHTAKTMLHSYQSTNQQTMQN